MALTRESIQHPQGGGIMESTEAVAGEAGNGDAPRAFLGRADILNREDTRYDEFQVPEWGDTWVRIRSITTKERERFEEGVSSMKNGKTVTSMIGARAKLCVLSLVDANGQRIMTDKDVPELSGKNSGAVNRIFRRACKLSGILQTEADLEEAVGNSETIRDDDS